MDSITTDTLFNLIKDVAFTQNASSASFKKNSWSNKTSAESSSLLGIAEITGEKTLRPQYAYSIVICAAVLCIIPLTNYLVTALLYELKRRRLCGYSSPPVVPYFIPWFGSLYEFLLHGPELCKRLVARHGSKIPMGIRTGPFTFYVITEPSQVCKMLRPPKELYGNVASSAMMLNRIFSLPWSSIQALRLDDSGPFPRPLRGSTVPANTRMMNAVWEPAHNHLHGRGVRDINACYTGMLGKRLGEDRWIADSWSYQNDLWEYMQTVTLPPTVSAVFGTKLFQLYPEFLEHFKHYVNNINDLTHGWPQWLRPKTYAAKAVALKCIKNWHLHLEKHPGAFKLGADELSWNELIGSEYARSLTKGLQALDEKKFGPEATAASVLGTMFASVSNTGAVMFWTLFEIIRRPELTQRIRKIIEDAGETKVEDLVEHPLLCSIFAEVTKMRVIGLLMRNPRDKDYVSDGWTYPKTSFICASSGHGALNGDVWNAGTPEEPHPLDKFWAERFIIYPDKPNSGPLRAELKAKYNIQVSDKQGIFSVEGLNGVYLSFGDGPGKCPGRHLARYETLSTVIVFLKTFDIELTSPPGWYPAMNNNFFPIGALPPTDKVPFRIRQRKSIA